ncbi:hypothetical protein [Paraburkholderia bryophila]|uniref:Uncharacterized protein n=1 Tax=Paraburkholderia bryophila TaxID=420952 RepID=A0A329BFA6_9BURK|nr:hypothetical protein [Paraburkholderia bryophila]RAS21506.1 hypothetical protein BX591_12825 [Paraburkholderia bryophila]
MLTLHEIAERYPELTGGGLPGGEPHVRPNILDHQAEFDAAMRFLNGVKTTSKADSRSSSYALKGLVQGWAGQYVSNGAMIAALIASGVPIARVGDDSPNVRFGILRGWVQWRTKRYAD